MTIDQCPKSMTFGPCGGVRPDASCEVDDRSCPFVQRVTMSWTGDRFEPRPVAIPRVVVDHRPSGDEQLDHDILTGYRELGVAVLLGDHFDDPVSVDRVVTAQRTTATGVSTIASVTGRDRSNDDRSRIITGFIDAGVIAVLCVTGDHPAARLPRYGPVEFTSEGTVLAHEARRAGAVVAVAESPASPPGARRSFRLRAKRDAGADFVILNHAPSTAALLEFCRSVAADGVALPFIAPVPVMSDPRSIKALAQFPGVDLPSASVRRVLDARDGVAAGTEIAVEIARELIADQSVAGVNLSGLATGDGPETRGRVMRGIAAQLVDAR